MRPLTILVVDDEPQIRSIVRGYLEADGFAVHEAANGSDTLQTVKQTTPDLIILDLMLPGLNGIDVLTRLRETWDIPVILLTARAEEIDKVIGLSAGADDYLTKPFSGRELVARTRAVLRRTERNPVDQPPAPIRLRTLTIDPARREVLTTLGAVRLTALDFDLLHVLASHPGQVLTRHQLLEAVWGHDYYGDDRVVDVHIRTLRKALGDDATNPTLIETVRAVGYRLIAA